jgi:hypothetical protein
MPHKLPLAATLRSGFPSILLARDEIGDENCRPPTFCSRSCRQRAYERRKWLRPHPVELLARDLDTAAVRDLIR